MENSRNSGYFKILKLQKIYCIGKCINSKLHSTVCQTYLLTYQLVDLTRELILEFASIFSSAKLSFSGRPPLWPNCFLLVRLPRNELCLLAFEGTPLIIRAARTCEICCPREDEQFLRGGDGGSAHLFVGDLLWCAPIYLREILAARR